MHQTTKVLHIQALRGIAVLLVLFYHLAKIEHKYTHGVSVLPDAFSIGMSGVDLFFVISGFVIAVITRDTGQNKIKLGRFLYHRVTRVYPLYWFYSLLLLAVFLIKPELINSAQGGQVNIVASFLLLPQRLLPLLAVGWTLIHEMYFYVIFALLLLFPQRWLLPLLFVWAIFVVGAYSLFLEIANPMIELACHPLTLEFIAGCFIAYASFKNKFSSLALQSLILGFIWWIAAYGIYVSLGLGFEPGNEIRVALFGVPAALTVFGLVNIENTTGLKPPKWMLTIGDASFSIYLSHVLVISAAGRIWSKLEIVDTLGNIFALSLICASALVIGILSYFFLERPILSITRRFEQRIFSK